MRIAKLSVQWPTKYEASYLFNVEDADEFTTFTEMVRDLTSEKIPFQVVKFNNEL